MARPKCDTPLVKFGRERGMDSIMSQLHYCYSLLFLHIIFFFSFFTRGNYLPTNHGAIIAGPALFSLPSLATIPCHYMIPRPRAHSISEQFSSTQKNLSYSVSPSTQFSIKLLLHISLSERNKLRRTRGVVDRGRGQES